MTRSELKKLAKAFEKLPKKKQREIIREQQEYFRLMGEVAADAESQRRSDEC